MGELRPPTLIAKMQNDQLSLQDIEALEREALQAVRTGRDHEAIRLWNRILAIDARHPRSLKAVAQYAFRKGDMETARGMFQRLVDADGSDVQHWTSLALACQKLGDEDGEASAIQRALSLDPLDLVGLILRASLFERQGKTHQAATVYGAVAAVCPPMERLAPDLRPALAHALAFRQKYMVEFGASLDRYLDPMRAAFAGEDLRRFDESVDIVLGKKRRYDSQSVMYHYPGLATMEFFDRKEFPWLDQVEAATQDMRDEFIEVLRTEEGFTPYITYPPDVPHNQFAELNNSPRWSAFHLYEKGKRNDRNAARCPRTMGVLDAVPQPDQPGRTPTAMFSLLKPRTRIPPHNGVTNVRLVTHLALIIPEKCGFRVGNQTREWVPGKAWVFDDTVEHEAWNDSDKLRVVLIFDIWHPHLTPPERAMITAFTAGMNEFSGDAIAFEP